MLSHDPPTQGFPEQFISKYDSHQETCFLKERLRNVLVVLFLLFLLLFRRPFCPSCLCPSPRLPAPSLSFLFISSSLSLLFSLSSSFLPSLFFPSPFLLLSFLFFSCQRECCISQANLSSCQGCSSVVGYKLFL